MATSNDIEPSVSALRARAEDNRAKLTETVETLRTQVTDTATDIKERFSPAAIKAEVTDYVRGSRDQLWTNLERKARDNPLQAVAVGAAVAYPAFKLLRAMPAPLLLIGAGLLLSRAATQQPDAVRDVSDKVLGRAHGAMESASTTFEAAADNARRTAHDVQDAVQGSVETVVDRATAAATAVRERVGDAADVAKAKTGDAVGAIRSQAEELVQQARDTVSTTWDKNPLVVASLGLAIGAVLAAAFPTSPAENAVFGDANEALRRKAGEAAAAGADAAHGLLDKVADAASGEGLSVDGLSKLGDTLQDKVRSVAERGIAAALNDPKSDTANHANPNRENQS